MNELLEVTRQLAVAARAGLPLGEALRQLPLDASQYLGAVREDLARGDTLARAVARYPRAFSPFYANMVEAAEAAERPAGVLTSLSRWLESSDRLERELRSALLYPYWLANALGVFLLLVAGLAGYALRAASPWWAPALGGLAAAGLLAFNLAVWTGQGRRLTALVPGLARLRRQAQEALWVRALGSLLAAGVPLPKALSQAAGVVWEPDLRAVGLAVERGTSLAQAAEGLEPVARWALQRGDAALMLFAAEHLESEVEARARRFIRELATVTVLALGLLVLASALLFWLPFYGQLGMMGEPNGRL